MDVQSRKAHVITGISSMAMRHALTELADAYEQRSRQRVAIVSVGGVEAARRVRDGKPFDFVVLAADAIEQLAANGRVDPVSRTDLARSGVAMAVATGAPPPDVSSEAAVRDAVLHARSVGYSTGPSGAHLHVCSSAGASPARLRRASCKRHRAFPWAPWSHGATSNWASSN